MTDPAPVKPPAPVCSCGRCDGRGALFILTTGAEERRPCTSGTRYDPKAAAGDRWKR